MKNLKQILTAAILFTGVQSFAQAWVGMYQTNYGYLYLVEESGPEYPNGSIVYGDYENNGTMVGKLTLQDSGFEGKFHNGKDWGSFKLRASINVGLQTELYSFNGTWGYGNVNNSGTTNTDFLWTGNRKTLKWNGIQNAVWSGKWNTNFGYLILEQVGDKVTGKYDTKGIIEGTYDKESGTFEGTFTNGESTGYFKFKIPCKGCSGDHNFFKGNWGWTKALEKGKWDGEKAYKNNIVKPAYKRH